MARSLAAKIAAANSELIVNGDLAAIGEFFTKCYVAHLTGRGLKGHAGIRRFLASLRRAFPKLQVEVEILAVEKTRVAWQRTLRGTHREEYGGFPPTGRRVVWRDMLTSRFEDGLIAEEWAISDLAEQLLRARKR